MAAVEAREAGSSSGTTARAGGGGTRPPSRNFFDRRLTRVCWALAALMLAVGSWFGWTQAPRPNPFVAPTPLESLFSPVERNALRRLPSVGSHLGGVFASSDGRTLWAVGSGGTILNSEAGGERWQAKTSGSTSGLGSLVASSDGRTLWAVGLGGTILKSEDGGERWQAKTDTSRFELTILDVTEADLNSLAASSDGRTLWAVGDGGMILKSEDGGERWQAKSSGIWLSRDRSGLTRLAPNSLVASSDGQTQWAVGSGGTILKSEDGGENWKDPRLPYGRWPWYWLLCAAVALVVALPLMVEQRAVDPVRRILDTAVSDHPVESSDGDLLGFAPLVSALSGFLRNAGTTPPLVLAVTAPWGQGKSSVMSMLKRDLETRGGETVWFNAWHHQKEEHLLASLLTAVRSAALPAWWRWRGIQTGWNLYRARIRKHPVAAILAAAVVFVPLGLMLGQAFGLTPTLDGWTKWVRALLEPPATSGAAPAKPGAWVDVAIAWLAKQGDWLAWAPTSIGIVWSLWLGRNRLKDSGLDPAKLLSTLSTNAKVKDLDAQLSFRHRFAAEFKEATEALEPRTLTIFIDDLDRCKPEAVGEILEAINFLVSSGKCFVVLGYYREHVERAVGLHFKDIAGEVRLDARATEPNQSETTDGKDGKDDERAREERRRYARRYPQKLVQIEVPVPRLDGGVGRSLLPRASADGEKPKQDSAPAGWLDVLRRWAKAHAKRFGFASICAAAVVALVALGVGGAWWLPEAPKPAPVKPATTAVTTPGPGVSQPPPPVTPNPGDVREQPKGQSVFVPAQEAPWPWALSIATLLAVLAAYGAAAHRR